MTRNDIAELGLILLLSGCSKVDSGASDTGVSDTEDSDTEDSDTDDTPTTPDAIAPVVTIVEPTEAVVVYAVDPLALAGVVTHPVDPAASLLARWDSDIDGELYAGAPPDDGVVRLEVLLSAGSHTLTLTGEGADGASATDSVALEVLGDNQPPTCGLSAPVDGAVHDTGEVVSFEGWGSDQEDGVELTYALDSDVDGSIGSGVLDASGSVVVDTSSLSDAGHQVSLTVTDTRGATCVDSIGVAVGSPPILAITTPKPGDLYNETASIAFSATVSDTTDAPQDLGLVWQSDLDGVLYTGVATKGGEVTFTHDGLSLGEHTITLIATDTDGMTAEATTSLFVNGLPTAPVVSITPDPAYTDDVVAVTIDVDSDDVEGDPVAYAYTWTIDGKPTGFGAAGSLAADLTMRGQTWEVAVTPNDGYGDGAPGIASVVIANSVPVVPSVTLTPLSPVEGDTLTCIEAPATDADGDGVTYTYGWLVDGVELLASIPTLPSGERWARDQQVQCTVVPHDGTDPGAMVYSNTVTVLNSAPSIESVAIAPEEPRVADALTCSYTGYADPDGDPDASTISWEVDGTAAGDGPALEVGAFAAGDSVTCTVTPHDGDAAGTPVSVSVTIQNTPPTIDSVWLTPDPAGLADVLLCEYDGFDDPDGDGDASQWSWTVNGVAVAPTTPTLAGLFVRDDVVTCTVTPFDGQDTGEALQASLTIVNTPPAIGPAEISPLAAQVTDDLVCAYTTYTDADGDSDLSTFVWSIDGTEVGTEPTLAAGTFEVGDVVQCAVTSHDGFEEGNTVTVEVTIQPSLLGFRCNPQDDNPLRYDCEGSTDFDAEMRFVFQEIDGMSRVSQVTEPGTAHVVTVWGLAENASFEYTAQWRGDADDPWVTHETNRLTDTPPIAGSAQTPFDQLSLRASTRPGAETSISFVATDVQCGGMTALVVVDRLGRIVWYDYPGPVLNALALGDDSLVYAIDHKSIHELSFSGEEVRRFDLAPSGECENGMGPCVHHDVLPHPDGLYFLYAEYDDSTYGAVGLDGCPTKTAYVLDRVGLLDPDWTAIQGSWWLDADMNYIPDVDMGPNFDPTGSPPDPMCESNYWRGTLGATAPIDYTHANAVAVQGDTLAVSVLTYNQIALYDMAASTLLWKLHGSAADYSDFQVPWDISPDIVDNADSDMQGQHHVSWREDGMLQVMDNAGAFGVTRTIALDLDPATGAAELNKVWTMVDDDGGSYADPEEMLCVTRGSSYELPSGNVLATCAASAVAVELDADDGSWEDGPLWFLNGRCLDDRSPADGFYRTLPLSDF